MGIQQQLDARVKELEALLNSELHSQLGISQNLVTGLETEGVTAVKVILWLSETMTLILNSTMIPLAGLPDVGKYNFVLQIVENYGMSFISAGI
jgi:replicative DNA helicase